MLPNRFLVLYFVFSINSLLLRCLPDQVNIAAVINADNGEDAETVRGIVEEIRSNIQCLPQTSVKLSTIEIHPKDSFRASEELCRLVEETPLAAVIGLQTSEVTSSHLQSLCSDLQMPFLNTIWKSSSQAQPHLWHQAEDSSFISLYPSAAELNMAFLSLIKEWAVSQFVVIYQDNTGLVRLQGVLTHFRPPEHRIILAKLPTVTGNDFRPFLKKLKRAIIRHLVIDCEVSLVRTILDQASEIGMISEYYSYIFTNLDLHLVDFQPYQRQHGLVNITAFQLLDQRWQDVHHCVRNNLRWMPSANKLSTSASLVYDAVHMFLRAARDVDLRYKLAFDRRSCKQSQQLGANVSTLIQYLMHMKMNGRTGEIKLNQNGQRQDVKLNIVELSKHGLVPVGTWQRQGDVNYTRTWGQKKHEIATSMANRTFRVVVAAADPYVIISNDSFGNKIYSGFCIELMEEIAKKKSFKVIFNQSEHNAYGTYDDETGPTGMIKKLMENEADLAIADLSITLERERGVDFSMPWMNLGISILYSKPTKPPPQLFSFLHPLSPEVWIYMGTAYLGVSVLLFILARLSPSEWQEPSVCSLAGAEPDFKENEMNLRNSFWFTIGSLMQQGCDINPKAVSTRMVATWWWIFTLIMISSYTANLAAFLTAGRMDTPINSAEDLAKQTTIKYGCVESGASRSFFRDSDKEHYQRMYNFMETARPSVYVDSTTEGVRRVRQGNYAFLMESSSIEYFLERDCGLTQIGGLLDHKSYGIALQPGSPYTLVINSAILEIQEEGTLLKLKNRWWKPEEGNACKPESGSQNDLGIDNVGGVFIVLLAGMAFSVLIAIGEFVWKSRKLAHTGNTSLLREMGRELQFAMSCGGSTKPMTKPDHMRQVEMRDSGNYIEYVSNNGK